LEFDVEDYPNPGDFELAFIEGLYDCNFLPRKTRATFKAEEERKDFMFFQTQVHNENCDDSIEVY
jgi:hypothetical protein